jgi:hypothetical protein
MSNRDRDIRRQWEERSSTRTRQGSSRMRGEHPSRMMRTRRVARVLAWAELYIAPRSKPMKFTRLASHPDAPERSRGEAASIARRSTARSPKKIADNGKGNRFPPSRMSLLSVWRLYYEQRG